MNILIACVVVVTVCVVVAVAFFVRTMIQVRCTAQQAEILFRNLNNEISLLERITGNLSSFIGQFSSPWLKVGSMLTGLASSLMGKYRSSKSSGQEK